MDTTDMTNAETTPTASTTASVVVMARPAAANLTHFTRPHPNMMGMARKNVNSAAAVLLQPHSMPPMMVAPEREVPGMMASTWNAADLQGHLPIDAVDIGDTEDAALRRGIKVGGAGMRRRGARRSLHAGMTAARCRRLLDANARLVAHRGTSAAQTAAITALHDDEHHAVQDKHGCNGDLVVEVGVHPIVEQDAHNSRRDASDRHHPPQAPGRTLLIGAFTRTQGIELMEVQREHGQDGTDLDDHQE